MQFSVYLGSKSEISSAFEKWKREVTSSYM